MYNTYTRWYWDNCHLHTMLRSLATAVDKSCTETGQHDGNKTREAEEILLNCLDEILGHVTAPQQQQRSNLPIRVWIVCVYSTGLSITCHFHHNLLRDLHPTNSVLWITNLIHMSCPYLHLMTWLQLAEHTFGFVCGWFNISPLFNRNPNISRDWYNIFLQIWKDWFHM